MSARVYTDEQLRAAWLACKLCTWPPTFEEAMADALRSRLVRLRACLNAHPGRHSGRGAQPMDPFAPSMRLRFTAPPGWVDHKRAAAGDRDD